MWRNRIGYAIWMMMTLAMMLFINNPGTKAIVLVSIVIPIISIASLYIAGRKISMTYDFDIDDRNARGLFHVDNRTMIPVACICFSIDCKNIMTGQMEHFDEVFCLAARSSRNIECEMFLKHCGRIHIGVEAFKATDWLGLVSINLKCEAELDQMIEPEYKEVEVSISAVNDPDPEGEKYSLVKSGNDPSEILAIREYIPGDSVKSIHWKLSNKMNSILVRELGLPVADKVLMILDTSVPSETEMDMIDELMSIFASVSRRLLDMGIVFFMEWRDNNAGTWIQREICSEQAFQEEIENILSNPLENDEDMLGIHMIEEDIFNRFSHVAIASLYEQMAVISDYANCSVHKINNYMDDNDYLMHEQIGAIEI